MEVDKLGIEKKYKDSSRADKSKDWFMGLDDWKDRIPMNKWLGNNEDKGKFYDSQGRTIFEWDAGNNDNVRLNVNADNTEDISTYNRKDLALRKDSDGESRGGYMSSSSDWRDIEITCYLYLYDIQGNDTLGWYARGGKHGSAPSCEGCKYEPNLFYKNGDFGVNKETDHGGQGSGDNHRKNGEDYDKLTIPDGRIGNMVGKWFGYKAVIYNLPSTGHYEDDNEVPVYPVKIELWIDETENHGDDIDTFKPKNNFVKKMETFDNPLDTHYKLWGDDGGCGGPNGVTLSWGGPVVTFRADKNSSNQAYKHFKMAFASVREIEPGVPASS
jgi:hypothetical protein